MRKKTKLFINVKVNSIQITDERVTSLNENRFRDREPEWALVLELGYVTWWFCSSIRGLTQLVYCWYEVLKRCWRRRGLLPETRPWLFADFGDQLSYYQNSIILFHWLYDINFIWGYGCIDRKKKYIYFSTCVGRRFLFSSSRLV